MAKVYVSSTIRDLEPEREAVMKWLRGMRLQAVDSYLPNSDTVRDSCLDDVAGCDLYVLILGFRYGFRPEDDNPNSLSITHLEFRRAGEAGIPRIALVRQDVPDFAASDLAGPDRGEAILAFRDEVSRAVRPAEFSNRAELIEGLSTGVNGELEKDLDSPGPKHDDWLAAHLGDMVARFDNHIAASALDTDARARDWYMDLVVRQPAEAKEDAPAPPRPLAELLDQPHPPLLVTGEGGGGKTTSLLRTGARAAEQALADPDAPVPIYVTFASLTKLDDVSDLMQLVADSVPLIDDWADLSKSDAYQRRGLMFLFDALNEMPEHLQRKGAAVLKRFVDKRKGEHTFVVTSRPGTYVDQLLHQPSPFGAFEILRLSPEQVQEFLGDLGLAPLYDRMPGELRELAGNPFMLVAIARTLAATPGSQLPRNRGELYHGFVETWMENEDRRRDQAYSYERVKQPLLAYLAKRMSAAGETSHTLGRDLDEEVASQLETIHERVMRLGGMPADWSVDGFLGEMLGDGLVTKVGDQLQFMHHSVQEYFTGLYFLATGPELLVDLMPRLAWDRVNTYGLIELPSHRLVPPLLMMAGLLEDGTALVEQLADRHPVLAAAAISSSQWVQPTTVSRLAVDWLELLSHEDARHRYVACTCVALAGNASSEAVGRLVAMVIGRDFEGSWVAGLALARLDAHELAARTLSEQIMRLSDAEYDAQKYRISSLVEILSPASVVEAGFGAWRAAGPDAPRRRLEALVADVPDAARAEALGRLRAEIDDPAAITAFEQRLADAASMERKGIVTAAALRQRMDEARERHADRLREASAELRTADRDTVVAALRSSDRAVQAAAATAAAERRLALGDEIVEALVLDDRGMGLRALVDALVALEGEPAAVAKLVRRSEARYARRGLVDATLAPSREGAPSDALAAKLTEIGVRETVAQVTEVQDEDGTRTWALDPSSWSGYRPLYRLVPVEGGLEVWDCNLEPRAFTTLATIAGDSALAALRRAVTHDDPRVREVAVVALAERKDDELRSTLLERLRTGAPPDQMREAFDGLAASGLPDALRLVDELLVIRVDGDQEVHPVWGTAYDWRGPLYWALRRWVDDEAAVRDALIRALSSPDELARTNALLVLDRWLEDSENSARKDDVWRMPELQRRLLELVLGDTSLDTRAAAAKALTRFPADELHGRLAEALHADAAATRVVAGDVLARLQAQDLYGEIIDTLLAIARDERAGTLRSYAGRVLSEIPGGVDALYQPIQATVGEGVPERALARIEATLPILPDDVNLFWWQGHALKEAGRLEEAVASFQRASALMPDSAAIPQETARTLLALDAAERAVDAALHAVLVDPDDADAQAILARSYYRTGAYPEAVDAANEALGIDPLHGVAMWVVLLGYLRQGNLGASRDAWRHACRALEHLSPGLDTSYLTTFAGDLAVIPPADSGISELVREIVETLSSR